MSYFPKYKLLLFIFLASTCWPVTGWGQTSGEKTSGLEFLTLGPNTTAFGFAEAHTAASIGPSNLYANPANMSFESMSSVGADYTLWFVDSKISHAAGTFVKDNHAFGVGIINHQIPDIQARDTPGPSDGSFTVSYLSVAGAYSRGIGNHISVGVTGHFLNEQYLVDQAAGYAFNLGVSTRWLNDRIRVAASVVNLGQMSELNNVATSLPTSARYGLSADLVEFTTPGENDLPLLIRLYTDLVQPLNDVDMQEESPNFNYSTQSSFNFGTEIDVGDVAILRAGYQTKSTSNFRPDVRKVSFGAGFWIGDILFNYSVIPFDEGFRTAHSIGIQYYFD